MKYEQKNVDSSQAKELHTWWLGIRCASEVRRVPLKRHFLSDVNLFDIDPRPKQAGVISGITGNLVGLRFHMGETRTNTKLELRDDRNRKPRQIYHRSALK